MNFVAPYGGKGGNAFNSISLFRGSALRKFRDGFIERWLPLFVLLLAAQVMITGNVAAKDPAVKELLLSLVQPAEVSETYIKEDGVIDKILSVTLTGPKGDPFAAAIERPVTEDYLRNTRSDTAALLVPRDNEILPGRVATRSLRDSWPRLASLDTRIPAAIRGGGSHSGHRRRCGVRRKARGRPVRLVFQLLHSGGALKLYSEFVWRPWRGKEAAVFVQSGARIC